MRTPVKSHAEPNKGGEGRRQRWDIKPKDADGSTRPSEGERSPLGNTVPEDIHLQLRERRIPIIPALKRWRRDAQRLVVIF